MNNYEEVSAMTQGTVFQFEDGAPWLRTEVGVRDLIPAIVDQDRPIPERWKGMNHKITVLYTEEPDPDGEEEFWDEAD